SDRKRRTIVQACKYQRIVVLPKHNAAKKTISQFFANNGTVSEIKEASSTLRNKPTRSDYARDTNNINADYLDLFIEKLDKIVLPKAEFSAPGALLPLYLSTVKVKADLAFSLQRTARNNKLMIGAAMLRYQKGKALKEDIARYQSAFIHGYLVETRVREGIVADPKLCITIDVYTGEVYSAPSNSVTIFKNMRAACSTIAEWWPNIKAPRGAVL
ncbi:MAG: hypothetical protein AAFN16_09095, partial [Pseudomonadota bacterium]